MANNLQTFSFLLILFAATCPLSAGANVYVGTVVDASSGTQIKDAFVTLGNTVVRTDQNGKFKIEGREEKLCIRAYGHSRLEIAATTLNNGAPILLNPFVPKALYLSFYGIGDKRLRESALSLIKETELNALVIDIKGDQGRVAFKSSTPLATTVGAQKIITIKNVNTLISELHAKGIYTIARIVVFKDDPLASARSDLAVKTVGGLIWKDREGLAWSNPFSKTVWEYNIDLAVEAAHAGFDEIQFDYARFPDAPGLFYSLPNTEENRVEAISGFLAEARKRLIPYSVFLAADIFGYVLWNSNDTYIGQKLESISENVDYMSPMLYPSGFKFGIPGYPNPVLHPREVVYLSLENAKHRTGLPAIRFRPWLQAFQDYAFDRMPFQGKQIRAQIDAAENFGSVGWMLWNPHNIYSRDGLQPKN